MSFLRKQESIFYISSLSLYYFPVNFIISVIPTLSLSFLLPLYVIPAKAGIHPSVIASTVLGARQSRIMSLQVAIYKNLAISSFLYVIPAPLCHFWPPFVIPAKAGIYPYHVFLLYSNISPFSDSKTIKKLHFLYILLYLLYK